MRKIIRIKQEKEEQLKIESDEILSVLEGKEKKLLEKPIRCRNGLGLVGIIYGTWIPAIAKSRSRKK